ncbi:uncharacterized protein LOC119104585 [Pollicipes pollicipes]|uniref:uncharacterized protein LOC119104585 n=1 Tax=Pollicipes pollicipes TaxID=41117 RepID=UPI001884F914|nr:uncharacterized protein LOC119104585 [Pollicipes pollicipes]
MSMPVFTGNKKVDKEEEDRKLAALLKDDFVADADDAGDEMAPVRLPLLSSASAASSYVTDDVKIKYEPDDEEDNVHAFMSRQLRIADQKSDSEVKVAAAARSQRPTDASVSAMLQESRRDLIFFQFPDCLPVLTSNDGDEKQKSKKAPPATSGGTDGSQSEAKAADPELVTFRDLPEGQVGRLQLLKSGRARLLLGQHVLHLEPGTQVKFLQEAASVSVGADGSRGQLALLGGLSHRVVCSPAWETLVSRSGS